MSHNPNRAMGANSRRVARKYDPKAGHRRKRGGGPQGIDLGELQNRESTSRGWRVTCHKGDEFEMVYELIAAHNATGKIKNDSSDRAIRVLRGQLFVLVDGNIITVREGQAYSIPKGTEYELCSDTARDVEVLICQGSDYEDGVEIIVESDVANPNPMTTAIPEQMPVPKRSSTGKALEAAQKISSEKMARQAARNPARKKGGVASLPGVNEPGANLRPMGDPGEGNAE